MHESRLNFLGLPPEYSEADRSRYAVLPVPYEATVTYMSGTAGGPMAIIEASQQVELFDEELQIEIHTPGVATYPIVQPAAGPEEQNRRIKAAVAPILADGKFLLAIGGEHGITPALVEAVAEAHGPISVLQIDAHADLRDHYAGSRDSHACVMRRVIETADRICQLGVRSLSLEEFQECPDQVSTFITPAQVAADDKWIDRAVAMLGQKVYITVDVDGFDPSFAPGVGTPEPGGLDWASVTALIRRVAAEREVVAADIVEVRPIPPNHITEFLAARLGCKIIAYTQHKP